MLPRRSRLALAPVILLLALPAPPAIAAPDQPAQTNGNGTHDAFGNVTFTTITQYGSAEWEDLGTVHLDLDNIFGSVGDLCQLDDLNDLNAYSDWWYVGYMDIVEPAPEEARTITLRMGSRTVNFHMVRKPPKGMKRPQKER